jgi:hypothetical protein
MITPGRACVEAGKRSECRVEPESIAQSKRARSNPLWLRDTLAGTTRPTRCILMVMVVMHLYSTTESYVCIDGDGSIEVIVIDLTL